VLDTLGEDGADAIGVNNRDLKSFAVSLETSFELVERIPAGVVRVAESGISTAEDLVGLRAAGFDAFLIAESLMRQPDPGAALARCWRGLRRRDEPLDQNLRQHFARGCAACRRGRRRCGRVCVAPSPRRMTAAEVAAIARICRQPSKGSASLWLLG